MLKIKQCVSILFCVAACAVMAGSTNELPKFDEVYQLLRAHLNGATEADLNRAAVEGLLAELKSGAMLVGGAAATESLPAASALGKSMVFDDSFAYLRVLKVDTNLPGKLVGVLSRIGRDEQIQNQGRDSGFAFCRRHGFRGGGGGGGLFFNADQPLLECGGVMVRSTKKDNAITVPLTALVNSKTSRRRKGWRRSCGKPAPDCCWEPGRRAGPLFSRIFR